MDWQGRIASELDKAALARARGNEGLSRVCARRAAGLATRAYFERRGIPMHSTSAVDLLQQLRNDPALPAQWSSLIDDLTLRVDEQFKLPPGVDLVDDAKRLCAGLLPD